MAPDLKQWVAEQRAHFQKGVLPPKGVDRLQILGLDLDPIPAEWEAAFGQLRVVVEEYGSTDLEKVAARAPDVATRELRQWLAQQRQLQANAELSVTREQRLRELGVDWRAESPEMWNTRLEQLSTFRNRYGHTNVAVSWDGEPGLGAWLEDQRRTHVEGALASKQFERLNELEISWELSVDDWEVRP